MENFLKELNEKFTLEDFTGHLGVLLSDDTDEEDAQAGLDFLQEIYEMAVNNLR